jgi:hypothetical protein
MNKNQTNQSSKGNFGGGRPAFVRIFIPVGQATGTWIPRARWGLINTKALGYPLL